MLPGFCAIQARRTYLWLKNLTCKVFAKFRLSFCKVSSFTAFAFFAGRFALPGPCCSAHSPRLLFFQLSPGRKIEMGNYLPISCNQVSKRLNKDNGLKRLRIVRIVFIWAAACMRMAGDFATDRRAHFRQIVQSLTASEQRILVRSRMPQRHVLRLCCAISCWWLSSA